MRFRPQAGKSVEEEEEGERRGEEEREGEGAFLANGVMTAMRGFVQFYCS